MGRPNTGGSIRVFPAHKTAYRLIYADGRQRFEHRVVMERALGRTLRRNEIVHHRDGNGLNNALSNLAIMSQAEHMRLHPKCTWPVAEALALRDAGWSLAAIGRKYGVCWSAIRSMFTKLGKYTGNLRWGQYRWDVARARRMRAAGASYAIIGRAVGVSMPTVRRVLLNLAKNGAGGIAGQ